MPKLRFPLVGSVNTRMGSDDLLSGQSGIAGEAIVGIAKVGVSPDGSSKDQRMINCFPIFFANPFSENRSSYLVKRPGWATHSTPQASSAGSAILVWSGQGSGNKVISAFGGTNSSIYDGASRLTTNNADTTVITGVASGITETQISGTATLLISSSDSTAWYYQAAGTVTKVSDSDFPGNAGKTIAGTFAHLDGFAFVMTTDGYIYNSDLNSVTSWTAANFIATGTYPDGGVACVRWRSFIIGFGPQTMEFFYNGGNAYGSPLLRNAGMTQKVGLANANAYAANGDAIFFAGSSPEGGISVYQWNGELTRVSTPSIENKLILAGPSNLSLSVAPFYGTTHLLVKAKTATYAYCVDSNTWYEWASGESIWDRTAALSVGSSMSVFGLSTTATSGRVYVLNPASRVFTDDGMAYTATFISAPVDAGSNNRKRWKTLSVIADVDSTSSNLTVSWSDDDYQTFNTATSRTISLNGGTGRIHRAGNSRQRIWRFDHSNNTPLRIREVELEFEEGAV